MSSAPCPRRLLATAAACGALLLALAPPAAGQEEELTGDPVDYGFEGSNACCVDVAGVNLIKYLERIGRLSLPPGRTTGQLQDDFHRYWDPAGTRNNGSLEDYTTAMKSFLEERQRTALIKRFYTKDLKYETLVKEWTDDELIVLFVKERTATVGHAVFLWGLDKTIPRIKVVDPNIEPNKDHKVEGESPTQVNGQPYTGMGVASGAGLTIGVDAQGFPEWRFTVSQERLEYYFGVDDQGNEVTSVSEAVSYDYRVQGFVSVSDVEPCTPPTPTPPTPGQRRLTPGTSSTSFPTCGVLVLPTPEPATNALLASGLVVVLGAVHRRRVRAA